MGLAWGFRGGLQKVGQGVGMGFASKNSAIILTIVFSSCNRQDDVVVIVVRAALLAGKICPNKRGGKKIVAWKAA